MKFLIIITAAAAAALAGSAYAGVGGPAFYVDGQTYRTVATPTDLSHTGAPAHTFDLIYEFGGTQLNVATAAPGDADYNGGRWQVHALAFNSTYAATVAEYDANGSGNIDSDEELNAALADPGPGGVTDLGVVKQFVCPAIKLANGG